MERLRELLLTALWTVIALGAIGGIFYNAFAFFQGINIVWAIVAQVALLVLAAYLLRWGRYPGIYASKSSLRLIGEYLAACFTFTGGLFIIALLARLHILRFLGPQGLGYRLGLEFKFKKGQVVKVSGAATPEHRLAEQGEVISVRVVAEGDPNFGPSPSLGTVIYRIRFADGECVEFRESELL